LSDLHSVSGWAKKTWWIFSAGVYRLWIYIQQLLGCCGETGSR